MTNDAKLLETGLKVQLEMGKIGKLSTMHVLRLHTSCSPYPGVAGLLPSQLAEGGDAGVCLHHGHGEVGGVLQPVPL